MSDHHGRGFDLASPIHTKLSHSTTDYKTCPSSLFAKPRGAALPEEGVFKSIQAKAVTDSEARAITVSSNPARALELNLDSKPARRAQLPLGKQVRTLGDVQDNFSFSKERKMYPLLSIVLDYAPHEPVLGSRPLQTTDALKTHRERPQVVYAGMSSIRLIGEHQAELSGGMDGTPGDVVLDTGLCKKQSVGDSDPLAHRILHLDDLVLRSEPKVAFFSARSNALATVSTN